MEPPHAAAETALARLSSARNACQTRRGALSKLGGRNGSCDTTGRSVFDIGSAKMTIAPTTANESWKPVAKSSFVSQHRSRNAAAARLFSAKTRRSKNAPPNKIELMIAARRLERCKLVTAA